MRKELESIMPSFVYNARQIQWLQDYLRGYHPAIETRVKTVRPEIDNRIAVNYPYSITRDIVGYFLGKPIQYTHKNATDEAIEKLNQILHAENKELVDFEIATDCSVCGIGFRGVFTDPDATNGTRLNLVRLDPRYTFVVYSQSDSSQPVYAVVMYEDAQSESFRYTVYTTMQMMQFVEPKAGPEPTGLGLEYVGGSLIYVGGVLPVIEYENNLWRMGDWEVALSLIDALDAVVSDNLNDIQQAVQSILVAMGVELTEEVLAGLANGGVLNVKDVPPGVQPLIEFISNPMDARIGREMRDYLESTLRVIVGVPDRKERPGGGGDTGDAVFMRDGWYDIDLVAAGKEPYFIRGERQAIQAILYVLSTVGEIEALDARDIEIHFNRNKTANIQSKAQVFQTLLASGMHPLDALDIANLTNNVNSVILRMQQYADERNAALKEASADSADADRQAATDSKAGTVEDVVDE
jgi:SPP1 family phage portal protein